MFRIHLPKFSFLSLGPYSTDNRVWFEDVSSTPALSILNFKPNVLARFEILTRVIIKCESNCTEQNRKDNMQTNILTDTYI